MGDMVQLHLTITMYRPKNPQERIKHRYKIVQGHLAKVLAMIDTNDNCLDILHQSQAIQAALREIDNLVLENHLRTCVIDEIQHGTGEAVIEGVVSVFKKRSNN